MISLYLQINIFIAFSWLVFRLLPTMQLPYRASKKIARILLVSSILGVLVITFLPDFSFPGLTSEVEVVKGQEIDSNSDKIRPLRKAIQRAEFIAQVVPHRSSYIFSYWLWFFLLGMSAMILRRLVSWYRLSILLNNTLTLHQIGRTAVVVSDVVAVPFSTLNLGRAYVVLPSELVPFRHDFRIALRHEIEHHRQGDTFWTILLEWLICVFYLNPAIYFWRSSLLQMQELTCDETLIARRGISKQAYASCLLRVAAMALDRRFTCGGTTCMISTTESNSHSFLKRRIDLFGHHERSVGGKAGAIVLGAVSSFTLLAMAYIAQAAVRSDNLPNQGKPIFDGPIQALAEQALRNGMTQHEASAGFAIVADPLLGTIIAAVSLNAGFDKNLVGDWALSYPLQPGSVLKPLIVASALEHQATKIDELHNCENGEYAIGKNLYHDVESFEHLSTAETIIQSSNICTIKISKKLGAKGLEASLHEFGVGKGGSAKDFPSAKVGHVPPAGVIPDDDYVGLVSHGISNRTEFYVTPLEMIAAYGAIANGGKLMKPIVADGKQNSEMMRLVLSSEVAGQMRETLRRVVSEGTAKGIRSSPVSLAGKTSTMVINDNHRITGFIGYAPADKPKVLVYVALFDPKGRGKFGSTTAAPVFREIIEKTLTFFVGRRPSEAY